ncbi:hypothetical protein ACIPQH_24085 [Streptomyces rubiginosohelvolus]|uniref:hypothetical protein n=1 Tax=Streptomyces TaxID=1883 RepID=UPI001CD483BE|nr:hypothetical protein [Streptomyces sp. 7G]MCA1268676.1 hypothetical protein [Streptomyces sp. 7G]
MTELYLDTFAITVRADPLLRRTGELHRTHQQRQVAHLVAARRGLPVDRIKVRKPLHDDLADAGDFLIVQQALTALGPPPERPQTLYLVRTGPLLDPMVAPLAATVHALGWPGDEVGVSHLEEQGGTLVFDLLAWAIPEDAGATLVVVDDPAYVDDSTERPAFAAVSLRLARAGALRIVACGEGTPPGAHAHTFSGTGPCDAWLGLYSALASGAIQRSERVLLRTTGRERRGWVLLEATRPERLHLNSVRI